MCNLQVMASNLPAEEIAGLKVVFEEIDTNKNGSITVEELREALKKKGRGPNYGCRTGTRSGEPMACLQPGIG